MMPDKMKPENPKVVAEPSRTPVQDMESIEEEPNVSPEEQKMYDSVVTMGMELLYAEDRMPSLVEKLKAGSDNISGEIGHSAAMTLTTINRTVDKQDRQIPEEVLYAAGQEIVSQLVDIAVAAGLVKQEDENKVAEAALYEGLRVWGQNMGRDGQINDDTQRAAQEQMKAAGIEQDTSKIRGRENVETQGQPAPQTAAPAAPPGAPGPGLVNQAMGMQP
jgi:hypothetical protein